MTKQDALQEAGARYTKVLTAFVTEANENQHMAALVDSLTRTLARIAVSYGTPAVMGEVLLRLGRHLGDLSERQQAQQEASRAREAGGLH